MRRGRERKIILFNFLFFSGSNCVVCPSTAGFFLKKETCDSRFSSNLAIDLWAFFYLPFPFPFLRQSCRLFVRREGKLRVRGGSRIFFRRGCTRLLLYFNTNKPDSFFFFLQNTSCIRKPQVILGRGGAHPLHPPPRSAPESTPGTNTGRHITF